MLSFWLERRLVMPPASRERVPCCWPMVPMTIGASIPSNDPLAVWPSPAYLPTAPASAVWSRPPSSDESICDPFSISEDWPEAPIMLAKLPRAPVCCFTASTSFCAPPGCVATPQSPASSPGTAAPIAVCVLLRSSPSAEAMRPIISGVRNCVMSETRLTAMGLPPLSLNWEQTFPSGASEPTTESQRRCCARSFPEAMTISDYARVRLAVLKIYGIPVRVFTGPISGFSASTFGETPNSRLRARCYSGAFPGPDTCIRSKGGSSAWLAGDDHGRSGARTNVRRQPFDHAHSTLPPTAPARHARDYVGVCAKCQRDRANCIDPAAGQLLDGLFVKFSRSTHVGTSGACESG